MDRLWSPPKTTPFERALADITISPLHKRILMERYNGLLLSMDVRVFRIALFFHASRGIVTVGSLIVPALLSIQYTNGTNTNLGIYWTTWVLSLMVTVCNGMMTLLKLDKIYYHLHTVREQLISDGWQYVWSSLENIVGFIRLTTILRTKINSFSFVIQWRKSGCSRFRKSM